jgi:hypothetical protein
VDAPLLAHAEAAKGFMPPDEGLALHHAGVAATAAVPGVPLVEIGSWCGKSSVYLGAAARSGGTVLLAVDHHRGSRRTNPAGSGTTPTLVDPVVGRIDTLPTFRRTIWEAALEDHVVALVGSSPVVAGFVAGPLALVFVDGGHGAEPAHADYDAWSPKVATGGSLVIHDVFPDPADGGRPPYEVYLRALGDGFTEVSATGSLRVLRRDR